MYSSIRHPERPLLRFLRSQQPLPYSPPLVKALGNGRPLLPKEARVVNRQAGGHARFNKSFPRTILRSCLPAFLPSVLPHAILTLGSHPLFPSLPLPTLVRFSRLSGLSATHPHLSLKKKLAGMRLENGISRNHKTPGSLPDHGLLYLSLRKSSDLQWHSICDDLVGFFFSFSSSFFLLPSSRFTVTSFTFRSPPFATVSLCIVIRVDLLTKEG